jgi:nicotinate dehydrogenase subunit B
MSSRSPSTERPPERIEARIVVEHDRTVTARSGKVEYGQGIRTGFAKIVAEELDLPIDRVRVELGETDRVPWDMGTFGSLSTATDGKALRSAAARARALLLERASARLGCPVAELDTRDGRVIASDGRAVTYAELAAGEPLVGGTPESVGRHATGPVEDAPLRLEALDIVTGKARYVADVRLPRMLRGHMLHPPAADVRLVSVNDRRARDLPGVVAVVHTQDMVGVVAERDEQALAALSTLDARWESSTSTAPPPIDIVLCHDDGVEGKLASGRVVEARYFVPHIAHASIGPSAAVADVRNDEAHLYVATHRPFSVRDEVAQLLSLSPERVHVHPQMMSGMYGRGNLTDAALDASLLSRAVKRPVLVQWTREEEFQLSPHRPFLDASVAAALDSAGQIIAWRYDTTTNSHAYGGSAMPRMVEMTSGRNAVPPYRLGSADITLHVVPAAVRTGPFRSLAAAPNVFAIESFVDELAHASAQDPIAFRLRHTDDARLRRVLETVRESSGWNHRVRQKGHGFGAACAVYHRTYVALVVEVHADNEGRVHFDRAWCAVDPGHVVHPDGARNQIEGGIQQAASWTLVEALQIEGRRVTSATWRDYHIATFEDAPEEMAVTFTPDPGAESTGIGEVGSVPTAAAIANALFDARGIRLRQLPLRPA